MRNRKWVTGFCTAGLAAMCFMFAGNAVYADETGTAARSSAVTGGGVTINGTVISNDETGIPDKALYEALAEYFDSNEDGVITEEEVDATYEETEFIFNLTLSNRGIKDLTGISKVKPEGTSLDLSGNEIEDITPLVYEGAYYADLMLSDNQIEDIAPLGGLSEKYILNLALHNNKIKKIPVGLAIRADYLSLSNNQITDISGMGGENGIEAFYLYLGNNQITDISPLMEGYYGMLWLNNNNISELPDNIGKTRLLEGDLIEDGAEYRQVSLRLDGNNITEAEAREKLPEEWVNFVTEYSGLSWFDMQGFIKDTVDEEAAYVVAVSGNEAISEEVFAEILEQNKEKPVIIENAEGVTFTFKAGEMQAVEGMTSYDFGTTLYYDYETLPEDLKKNADENTWICSITYHYSGKLPAKADIRIYTGLEHAGKTLYYSYYKENGKLDYVQAAKVDEEGYVTVSQDHCSSYLLTTKKPATGSTSGSNSDDSDFGSSGNSSTNANSSSITVRTGTWVKDETGWWYSYSDNTWPASKWKQIKGMWYYFDASGYMAEGWRFLDGKWYYLNPEDGNMAEGWKFIDGKWYYLNPVNGDMAIGWTFVNGKWYFLTANGDCLLNTITPDGYKVDESGAWVE